MDKLSNSPLQIGRINRQELAAGAVLVVLSFFVPLLFTVQSFHVLHSLEIALRTAENTRLMAAGLQLVFLNAVRSIPHYVGAYFIGESIDFRWREKNAWPINAALIMVILLAVYRGIDALWRIRYDFGLPAILVSLFVVLFRKLNYRYISLSKKVQLILLFLTAVQFLDVMPALRQLPVGRGETSWDVKQAAIVLEGEAALNAMSVAGFLIFTLFGLLIFFQLRDENTLRELSFLKEQNESIRTRAQINEIQNRTYQEMQYLVHDLKSPLTAVQTLIGVVKMSCEAESLIQDVEYLERAENSVEQMSRMISEILNQDQRSPLSTEALMEVVLAQISVADYADSLRATNLVPDAVVCANRSLFPRALVNLIQNAASAIPAGRQGEIRLLVESAGAEVAFRVSDNGQGIPAKLLPDIWALGVSGSGSSGLGLPFVRRVVEQMGGRVTVDSRPSGGTTFSIMLPVEEAAQ